ncbi:hypothetical protein DFP95_12827 [Cohnella lupini]|uniref:Uncharacterized protein n=1 Tax=Cohnella lupini TaxID=1294267 RepID=A0A3D9HU61_9BACL|nr:hypothetical protein DFP95_12827 [Cohnella lupini]
MKIAYQFDSNHIHICEGQLGTNIEFAITIINEELMLLGLKEVQKIFKNRATTDVLFLLYGQNQYRVIVRNETYLEFLLELKRQGLLLEVGGN